MTVEPYFQPEAASGFSKNRCTEMILYEANVTEKAETVQKKLKTEINLLLPDGADMADPDKINRSQLDRGAPPICSESFWADFDIGIFNSSNFVISKRESGPEMLIPDRTLPLLSKTGTAMQRMSSDSSWSSMAYP